MQDYHVSFCSYRFFIFEILQFRQYTQLSPLKNNCVIIHLQRMKKPEIPLDAAS